jgi:hypothetical protein
MLDVSVCGVVNLENELAYIGDSVGSRRSTSPG